MQCNQCSLGYRQSRPPRGTNQAALLLHNTCSDRKRMHTCNTTLHGLSKIDRLRQCPGREPRCILANRVQICRVLHWVRRELTSQWLRWWMSRCRCKGVSIVARCPLQSSSPPCAGHRRYPLLISNAPSKPSERAIELDSVTESSCRRRRRRVCGLF